MDAPELRLSASHVSSILLFLRDNMDITTFLLLMCLFFTVNVILACSQLLFSELAQVFFHLEYMNDI